MTFKLSPPLVSVVVSNYNYGRFLQEAIASVRAQSYKWIECIIVDDCSTDESADVIDALHREWPALTIIRNEVNRGQSATALAGFRASRGDFVVFLDADDVLFQGCIAHHVSIHMCSRRAVGFSCCDAVQFVGERVVVARNGNLSSSFLALEFDPDLISYSPLKHLSDEGILLPSVPAQRIRHVPWNHKGWPWTTTSSMFFRRDALDLVVGAAGLSELRICTDNFLAHSINLLTGSIISDEQFVAYRLHGSNLFNKRPPLDGFLCHNPGKDYYFDTCRIFLDDLITRFDHYNANIASPNRIISICMQIDQIDDADSRLSIFARSRLAKLLRVNAAALTKSVGRARLRRWIVWAKASVVVAELKGRRRAPPNPTIRGPAAPVAAPAHADHNLPM